MPELPEVEVTRAGLADRLLGATVRAVRLGKPLRWPLGVPPERLLGRQVGALQRRGKYLWMPLQRPAGVPAAGAPGSGLPTAAEPIAAEPGAVALAADARGGLLLHLGMSGALGLVDAPAVAPGPHVHFELETDRGLLRLTDPRRFGAVLWSDALDREPARTLLARLGAEPFDPALTPQRLHAALQARRSPIKTALLGGDLVVGAGNIYASEALFEAGIDPRTPCQRIGPQRAERLLLALRQTLQRAIALGGSTLRDFRDSHGHSGAFQLQAQVYDREGQACRRCGATVRRIVQGQRSSYFCPGCQRR